MLERKIQSIKVLRDRYKIYIMPLVLLVGFFLDTLTLNRVDQLFDNLILITHLCISGLAIILLFGKDTTWGQRFGILKHAQKIEYVMLFSFGAVFSGSVIFYSKSASLGSSWPFLLLLLILMLGTEFQRKYFQRLLFQINFYFIALFSYLIILVPVLQRDMGPDVFLVSGFLSLFFILFFFQILYFVDATKLLLYLKKMILGVVSIFLIFNFLYFTNIIPPIPLSLKYTGAYYSVYRVSDVSYIGTYEEKNWLGIIKTKSKTLYHAPGEPIYVFSSVFAPTDLNSTMYHQWQYFDPIAYRWVDSSRIELDITGGREGGFRGYSFKRSLENGRWRVLIETERGQKLGQIQFKVLQKKGEVELQEEVL